MAQIQGPIASAVIIPEPEAAKSPASKRRRSTSTDSASKRVKLEPDASTKSLTDLRESPKPIESSKDIPVEKKDPNQDRRKSSVQEEKRRGQRLFGGLLSTLSQSTPNGQQKRRLEIEKRQQEKAKEQKAADEVRRAEKLANLKAIRRAEQKKFDEASMHIRHSNMMSMAQFLSTKTEPKLYYKPWELLPPDEERIKKQIVDTETIIEREVAEHQSRYPADADRISTEAEKADSTSREMLGEPHTESPSDANLDTTNNVQESQSVQDKVEKNSQEEHNGEVVVENEEDTVIY